MEIREQTESFFPSLPFSLFFYPLAWFLIGITACIPGEFCAVFVWVSLGVNHSNLGIWACGCVIVCVKEVKCLYKYDLNDYV